ncbi:MAG: hypothetical protein A2X94_12070 [Bdellovibrionales bacterium GWB1_55_8]|nr:MAG: hypothetical protein A2X94_12070 [Bdellovibrionales bacterium GWB1_55_8]
MASNPRSTFDFSAHAKALLKQISPKSGATPNTALAVAAIEVALREAFSAGQQGGRRQIPVRKPSPDEVQPSPKTCDHEWEEAFLDGRNLGNRCAHCNILQRDAEEHCNHYFVDVSGTQVCMACRKIGKPRGR